MSANPFNLVPGDTELSEEEQFELIPSISTKAQLNEIERLNINEARIWALRQRVLRRDDLLSDHFSRELHKRMFSRTWKWAGKYRSTEKNLGWEPYRIAEGVRNAFDDANIWLLNETYDLPDAAIRLHHRLVLVHPWPNGNGRHARLVADVLIAARGGTELTWGARSDLAATGEMRARYIAAMKMAAAGDFGPLVDFARH